MRSPNVTVLSYGKNPRARNHNKPQYYLARHIIDYRPTAPVAHDVPDLSSKPVPLLTFSAEAHLQSQHKSTANSQMERSRRSEVKMMRSVSHIEFEKLYYTELEKNKHMEMQVVQLKDANERLHGDKKALKDHYEEFIRQLQNEAQTSKLMESKFNTVDSKRRAAEEEVHKLRVEVDMLRQNQTQCDDQMVDELRERIKALNQEKIDLLNSLQNNKTEILNLRTQINYFQSKEKEASASRQADDEHLKDKLRTQEIEIIELRKLQGEADFATSALKLKDSEIAALKLEIENLNLEIRKLKEQLENRDNQINFLNTRIRTLETHKSTSLTEIVRESPRVETSTVTRYPTVERLSVRREPVRIETSTVTRLPTVERMSVRREPVRIERSVSPPPTVVRTYASSPIAKREYIDTKTACCCCARCDYCLGRANQTTSLVNIVDDTKERYSVMRQSRPEVVTSTLRTYEPTERRPITNMRESRSVTRYNLADDYQNNDYTDMKSTRMTPNYSFRDQKQYKTSGTSVSRARHVETSNGDISPRGNKSLELYKYYDDTEASNTMPKQTYSSNNVLYGKTSVHVNGKRINSDDSLEYEHKSNNSRVRLSESRNSNVFTDGKYNYGKDSHRFSEYNYM